MHQAKISWSASSNMGFSRPRLLMILAGASVRELATFSVPPCDSSSAAADGAAADQGAAAPAARLLHQRADPEDMLAVQGAGSAAQRIEDADLELLASFSGRNPPAVKHGSWLTAPARIWPG
jgi:hypothetical protein